MKKTILILAANPKDMPRLRLDEEVREINEGLQRSEQRDDFILEQRWAVRPIDVRRAVLACKPNIIHFCGHGKGEEGIAFEDGSGKSKLVSAEALSGFFVLFADKVECVLLNACYSEIQAGAIANHIEHVIGIKNGIGDSAAIEFAVAFYDALGAGESFEFAYRLGCNAMQWAGIPGHFTPVLLQKSDTFLQTKDWFKIEEEGVFPTVDRRISVKLSILIKGIFKSPDEIKEEFHSEREFLKEAQTVCFEEIEKIIGTIDVERFYMRYYYSNDPDEIPIEKLLQEGISNKLKEQFKLSEFNILLRPVESDLLKRIWELQKGFYSFEFDVFPLREGGRGEGITFHIDFKILGIHECGWYTFQSNSFTSREEELQKIQSLLREDAVTKLQTIPGNFLRYKDIKDLQQIKKVVDLSVQRIVEVFGLMIEIVTLRRLPTISEIGSIRRRQEMEKLKREAEIEMAKMINDEHIKILTQLIEKRRQLIEVGIPDDDPELMEINQRIEKIIQKETQKEESEE